MFLEDPPNLRVNWCRRWVDISRHELVQSTLDLFKGNLSFKNYWERFTKRLQTIKMEQTCLSRKIRFTCFTEEVSEKKWIWPPLDWVKSLLNLQIISWLEFPRSFVQDCPALSGMISCQSPYKIDMGWWKIPQDEGRWMVHGPFNRKK